MAKTFVVKNIGKYKVPVLTSRLSFKRVDNNLVQTEALPLYCTYIENGNLEAAADELCRTGFNDIAQQFPPRLPGFTAPLAVSAKVPAGTMVFDYESERILVNEFWAEQKGNDADGDRASGLVSSAGIKSGKWDVLNVPGMLGTYVKFPIVKAPVNLRITTNYIYEDFSDLTLAQALAESKSKEYDLVDIYEKMHQVSEVGLWTWKINSYELELYRYIRECFNDDDRYQVLEVGILKSSKSLYGADVDNSAFDKYANQVNSLDWKFGWLITGVNSIGRKKFNWMWKLPATQNVKAIVDAVREIAVGTKRIPDKWFTTNEPGVMIEEFPFTGSNNNPGLIKRLLKMGIIEVVKFPHAYQEKDPTFPPVYRISLKNYKGEYMALVDNKREAQMSYAGILYPIFDIVEGKYVDPLDYMQRTADREWKDITRFSGDRSELESNDPRLDWKWPSKIEQTKSYRSTMLQEFVTEFVCRYGDVVPAYSKNGQLELTPMSLFTAMNTVCIDYIKEKFQNVIRNSSDEVLGIEDITIETKFKIALKADAQCRICLAGGKGNDQRVRKYLIAYDNGVAITSNSEDCDQKRSGAIRSQLVRASKVCKMTVAVVDMNDTKTGVLITPSGIDKQLENVFLPRISYEPIPEDDMGADKWTEKEIPSWDGSPRVVWMSDAKKALKIGKLIDRVANKFMPRGYKQAALEDGTLIDLLIPYTELNKKGCAKAFLKNAREEYAYIHVGENKLKKVKVLVTERTLFRSGNASENAPAEWRYFSYKGIDGMKIAQVYSEIGTVEYPEIDYAFAYSCFDLAKKLDPSRGKKKAR